MKTKNKIFLLLYELYKDISEIRDPPLYQKTLQDFLNLSEKYSYGIQDFEFYKRRNK